MPYTSEIDKLEARFRDNPKGRNFAPLADAYRKAGLIDNAIDLCQNGLKLHPDYVSAYIVYARCLVDKKDDAAAEGVFKQVLDLDRENIIALRGLAELAERTGNNEQEVEWLSRLLNADPMNGDAAEALARAKGKVSSKPAEAAAPPAAAAVAEAETTPMAKPDFAVDKEAPEPVALRPSATQKAPSADIENFESPITFNPNAHANAKAEGLEVQEDVELNSQQIEQVEIEGLARTQYEGSGMFKLDAPERAAPPDAPIDLDDSLPQVDLPLIMPDEESRPVSKAPAPPPPPQPPPPPSPRVSTPAAVALSDDDGAADTATLSKAQPVVTETMAELYLKQGHQQDALRVYQALLAQRPNDERLKSKVEQLSSGGKKRSGVSAQAFLKGIWSGMRGAPSTAPPPRAPAAAAPESAAPVPLSVEDQQSTLAAAFDVAEPAGAQPMGEPSHPAQDHISLDSVFGEESSRRPRLRRQAAPSPDPTKTGGFSFDEFFAGAKPDASATPASPKTPGAGGGRTSGRTQRPPEDEAEADQFQQWLKKLKS